jgi:hypothetical protein
MTGYAMSEVVNSNIRLQDWPVTDWSYDAHFDVIFVREQSPFYTYLALKLS